MSKNKLKSTLKNHRYKIITKYSDCMCRCIPISQILDDIKYYNKILDDWNIYNKLQQEEIKKTILNLTPLFGDYSLTSFNSNSSKLSDIRKRLEKNINNT